MSHSTHHRSYHSSGNSGSGKSFDISKGGAAGIGALALIGAGRILRGAFRKGKELAVDIRAGANLRKRADTTPSQEGGSNTENEKKDSSPKK